MHSYLPKHFWYEGMHKVKAGKGYDQDGRPVGKQSGNCSECGGQQIQVRICYGFETAEDQVTLIKDVKVCAEVTMETVCEDCGLVTPGAFIILDKTNLPKRYRGDKPNKSYYYDDYKGQYYDSHEHWKEIMMKTKPDPVTIDWGIDPNIGIPGQRADLDSDGLRSHSNMHIDNPTQSTLRLFASEKRLRKTNASKKMPMKEWRLKEYHDIADDYIHMLDLNKADGADVHYYINNIGVTFKYQRGTYKADDVIYHYCLILGNKDLRKYKEYNKRLYDLLTERISR